LIDVDVDLAESGGFSMQSQTEKQMQRELAGYLYSGVTAVSSSGDSIDTVLKVRGVMNSGERLGAQLFVSETPAQHAKNADGIKVRFGSANPAELRAVAPESGSHNLPVVVRTSDSAAIADALKFGVDAIEPGPSSDAIPDEIFTAMKHAHVGYDPTLSAAQSLHPDLLNRPLVLQTAPPELLAETRKLMESPAFQKSRGSVSEGSLEMAKSNLLRAWRAGVTLVTGSNAGSPLVFHGPTVQHELELWVEAGIPTGVALQAATANAARLLRADQRFGAIRIGMEATLVMVDGNPLADIHALSSISSVILKGERVSRSGLFEDE
jgi:imidazolonepropionase-like amidohydrolase